MIYSRNDNALSVTQLNGYIKSLLENDAFLGEVAVRGEISNMKYHTSGHLYFTLKDGNSEIAAVMFRSSAQRMSFRADNGMSVTAYGKVSVYEKSGRYQLYVSAMTDDGFGALFLEYRRLYEKLSQEGLFSEERKRPIPNFPKKIGIITSPTGAAIRDMLNVTGRRWRCADVVIFPSLVQGTDAPENLRRGIEYFNADRSCDVIIIGRGGGSIEDLWAFNDEALTRAVAASEIPVISAVGHEVDFTLCDFASDLRAPTPSAAAELAVPDSAQIVGRIDEAMDKADICMTRAIERRRALVADRMRSLELRSPSARLARIRQGLENGEKRLDRAISVRLDGIGARLAETARRLDAVSPLSVLSRGYGMLVKDGRAVGSVERLSVGDRVDIRLSDGCAEAEIVKLELGAPERRE